MKFHNSRARLRARFFAMAIASLVVAIAGFGIRAQDAEATPAAEASEAVEAAAEEEPLTLAADVEGTKTSDARLHTTWIVVTGILVFFMQAGFAVLEAGLIRQKGVVNALVENFMDAALTAIVFWALGFGIAFGADAGGLIGTDNFFLAKAIVIEDGSISFPSMTFATAGQVDLPNLTVLTFFFFQFAFAAIASIIATVAMAERTDFVGDLIYTALMGAFLYPIVVHWVWGGGWLGANSFHDFAGSTVVHAVGGFTAPIGAWMLGPRANREFGKFPPAHNLGLATLGTMILWFGWYGFNPGSTLGFGDPGLVGLVLINTTLAAAAGTLAAMFLVYARTDKWDLTFTLNGSLAGLMAIMAGCAFVMPWAAVVIGAVGGILVYVSVEAVEALKVDDPVGAFSVHGACGV